MPPIVYIIAPCDHDLDETSCNYIGIKRSKLYIEFWQRELGTSLVSHIYFADGCDDTVAKGDLGLVETLRWTSQFYEIPIDAKYCDKQYKSLADEIKNTFTTKGVNGGKGANGDDGVIIVCITEQYIGSLIASLGASKPKDPKGSKDIVYKVDVRKGTVEMIPENMELDSSSSGEEAKLSTPGLSMSFSSVIPRRKETWIAITILLVVVLLLFYLKNR